MGECDRGWEDVTGKEEVEEAPKSGALSQNNPELSQVSFGIWEDVLRATVCVFRCERCLMTPATVRMVITTQGITGEVITINAITRGLITIPYIAGWMIKKHGATEGVIMIYINGGSLIMMHGSTGSQ